MLSRIIVLVIAGLAVVHIVLLVPAQKKILNKIYIQSGEVHLKLLLPFKFTFFGVILPCAFRLII